MMVVTSPMGLQAPPALAAMITMPAKVQRSLRSRISLRSSALITMAVVMLSSAALRKKAMMLSIHSSDTLLVPVMRSVITRKPSCTSISSTTVMAPIRKKRIPAMSPRCSMR